MSNYKSRAGTEDKKAVNFSRTSLRDTQNDDNNDYNEQNHGESKVRLQISSRSVK